MAHESSENETTAALMNTHFVNIKVGPRRAARSRLGQRVAVRVGIARDSVMPAPLF
jgi:Protein of unknown function, DUF255